ncbi:MAG: DUF4105 domain-containing protein [Proteobacteria bacterium]|nr:MAG: DUF4105 domain-containing protein [Pseudomonadota bacterium]
MPNTVLIFSTLVYMIFCASSVRGEALPQAYLIEAKKLDLAHSERWLRILFFERHSLVRGDHGLIDDPEFYLSPDGKSDPEAEMRATLDGYFKPQISEKLDQHALCRFPARRLFLEESLSGLAKDMPKASCPAFERWWKDRTYTSLSLVFSSFYPDNPASMFGHVFLRLHRTDGPKGSDLLDDSINFSAFPNTTNPLTYNVKGAFGGFPGRFSLMPYYMKIQEYTNLESRDLWEYPLNADKAQIERILLSLWEFGPHYANYFYFDDNCSYIMLMLIEAGDPSWELTSQMRVWATPSACLNAVSNQQGFIKKSKFRASALSRYQERFDGLNGNERTQFQAILESGKSSSVKAPTTRVLDSMLEYIDFQEKLAGTHVPVKYATLRDDVLLQRSQIRQAPEPLSRTPEDRDPRLAVPESWLMLGAADRDSESLVRLTWQPVLHDLLGARSGYAEDMQLQIMPMVFSFNPKTTVFNLDRLDLLNVVSIQPNNRLIQPKSWLFNLNYDRHVLCLAADRPEKTCPQTFLSYGRGVSVALGESRYAPLLAGFVVLGLGAEAQKADEKISTQAKLGPELLLSGVTPWEIGYSLRSKAQRRFDTDGRADWFVTSEAQLALRVAKMQQIRLNAVWDDKKTAGDSFGFEDFQIGILQHF